MKLLKRGTVNVLITGEADSVQYHFDPMNADAELTYLKLKSIIGKGEIQEVKSNSEIRPLTVTGTLNLTAGTSGIQVQSTSSGTGSLINTK